MAAALRVFSWYFVLAHRPLAAVVLVVAVLGCVNRSDMVRA